MTYKERRRIERALSALHDTLSAVTKEKAQKGDSEYVEYISAYAADEAVCYLQALANNLSKQLEHDFGSRHRRSAKSEDDYGSSVPDDD